MHTLSRREILRLIAASAAAPLAYSGSTLANAMDGPRPKFELFFDENDLSRMRQLFREDPRFEAFRDELLGFDMDAERKFIADEVRFNDQLFHLRRLGRTAEEMAFRYALTGEDSAADMAIEVVRTIMKFERWDFFLDGDQPIGVQRAPQSTVAVSLAADWLGDRISDEERATWLDTMAVRGCEACYHGLYGIRYPLEVVGWRFDPSSTYYEHRPNNLTDMNRRPEITHNTNLRAVPASALTIGAVAHRLQNGITEDNERWLEMALFSVRVFGDVFKPDGSYDEGVSYANYTALHLAQATAILNRHFGPDLSDLINWKGYGNYVLNMWMPTEDDPYDIVNFGDNGNPKPVQPGDVRRSAVPAWVARTKRDSTSQWLSNHATGARDQWSLIWFDPDVQEQAPAPGRTVWASDLDWIVARTGFTPDDLVVAMRSGGPANHEHADRNGIIVKCFGEQLVSDPHRPPYSFADPSWKMRLTQGHSAVLIDGRGHEHHNGVEGTNASSSYARIETVEEGDRHAYWKSNATQSYRLVDSDIKHVTRELIVLFDTPAVVVVDRVSKWATPSSIEARFFGYNYDGHGTIEATPSGFVTRRPGAVLTGTVAASTDVAVESRKLDIPEERAVQHPFASVATQPAMEHTLVTVLALTRPGDAAPESSISIDGGRIEAQIGDLFALIDEHVEVR